MSELALRTFATYAAQPQGMILLSGPTGSGKSTTLYAALRHRLANHPGRFITVEEPVEFDIVGVAQIEVDTADKVRFDTVLRNILRSDPDVIMIGEIRDLDSAPTPTATRTCGWPPCSISAPSAVPTRSRCRCCWTGRPRTGTGRYAPRPWACW